MGIAAQGLQDPMDDMGLPALDAGPGLEGSALDAGAGQTAWPAGFGGGLGGDLGSGLDGEADPMGLPMLEGEGCNEHGQS